MSRVTVPAGLTNDRSAAGLAAVVNNNLDGSTCSSGGVQFPCNFPSAAVTNPVVGTAPNDISPVAYALSNYKIAERTVPDSVRGRPGADNQL